MTALSELPQILGLLFRDLESSLGPGERHLSSTTSSGVTNYQTWVITNGFMVSSHSILPVLSLIETSDPRDEGIHTGSPHHI